VTIAENEEQSPERQSGDLDQSAPNYWAEAFKDTPLSIVVPPYIRFLQGSVVLYKALAFLKTARQVAAAGDVVLSKILAELDNSKDSKQLGVDYEKFFASHLTITLVSEVEHFLGSAVAAALRLYPEKMGSQTVKLADVLSVSSKEEIIDRAARGVMNALMYEKPLDYLKNLANILSIDEAKFEKLWPVFVELKARRDVGVHNNWNANEIYIRKIREAGTFGTCSVGEHLIPNFAYLLTAMDSCKALVEAMVEELGKKWLPLIPDTDQPTDLAAADATEPANNALEQTRGQ